MVVAVALLTLMAPGATAAWDVHLHTESYRSPGALEGYEPVQGTCSIGIIPPGLDCEPRPDIGPLDEMRRTSETTDWHIDVGTGVRVVFQDAAGPVMFKVDDQMCYGECTVPEPGTSVHVTIDPSTFPSDGLAWGLQHGYGVPTSGSFGLWAWS